MNTYQESLKEFRRKYFLQLMLEAEGSVSLAATIASMNRTELYRALRRHDIDPLTYKDMRIKREEVVIRKKEVTQQRFLQVVG